MIDIGLLAPMIVMLAIPATLVRAWPSSAAPGGVFDTGLGALLVGLAVGRVAAMLLDDSGSLSNFSDILIIRSGVEFWPGLVAGLGWLAISARRETSSPIGESQRWLQPVWWRGPGDLRPGYQFRPRSCRGIWPRPRPTCATL